MSLLDTDPWEEREGISTIVFRVIKAQPGITTREVVHRINRDTYSVRSAISRLKLSGKIEKMENENGDRRGRWQIAAAFASLDDPYAAASHYYRTVKVWTPHNERDELVAALFGPKEKV